MLGDGEQSSRRREALGIDCGTRAVVKNDQLPCLQGTWARVTEQAMQTSSQEDMEMSPISGTKAKGRGGHPEF